MEQYLGEIGIILAVFVIHLLKEGFKWYKSTGRTQLLNFNKNVTIDNEINRELQTLTDRIDANRCSIIKYHNGIESFDGCSFTYATMTHETVDQNTTKMIEKFQKIPLSLFSESLVKLSHSPSKYIIIDSDDSNSGIMQAGWNVKRTYNFMLNEKLSTGILCCAYTEQPKELTEEQILEIKSVAYKINVLLDKKK